MENQDEILMPTLFVNEQTNNTDIYHSRCYV